LINEVTRDEPMIIFLMKLQWPGTSLIVMQFLIVSNLHKERSIESPHSYSDFSFSNTQLYFDVSLSIYIINHETFFSLKNRKKNLMKINYFHCFLVNRTAFVNQMTDWSWFARIDMTKNNNVNIMFDSTHCEWLFNNLYNREKYYLI